MENGGSESESFDSVTGYLSWDHQRLAELLAEAERAVLEGELKRARGVYHRYDEGVRRHIRIEESLLFPLFEARIGGLAGPTALMRTEHREMLKAADMMRDGLAEGSADAFKAGLSFLREVLPRHSAKEERILYPATDNVLSLSERASVLARLRSTE